CRNCCGVPVASAWARVKRRFPAISFADERICMRSMPPPRIPAESTPAMAMSPTTTSTSMREKPRPARLRLLLDPDVRIHALASRLPVGTVADDVEAAAVARHAEFKRRIPRIGQLALRRIRAQPAADPRRLHHQVGKALGERAGVHLVVLDLARQGLHLGLGQVDPGTVAE